MKPLPHVHTYVQNGAGERISKCIHADEHPRVNILVWGTDAFRKLFGLSGSRR